MAKVQQYEEAFNSIKAATQLNDIDALVEEFVKAEQHNYSLFNYVKDLTTEMDELEDEIKRIREEIDTYKGQGVNNENNKEKILKQLNQDLEATENETREYQEQYKETIKTINALKIGIQSIFDRIGCNNESVQEMLGTHGVTESNMMQYLGIIEQRTNEILQMYSSCQTKGGFEAQQQQNQAPAAAPAKEKTKVEPPEVMFVGEEEDKKSEEDGATRALHVSELKKFAQQYAKEKFDKMIKPTKRAP